MAGAFSKKVVGPALFVLLTGCTAVLGIHSAEFDDSVGASGPSATGSGAGGGVSQGRPKSCETVASECSACLMQNCGSDWADCLSDETHCGPALDAYAKCLGPDCMDKASCGEALAMSISSGLPLCMKGCGSKCAGGIPISNCDLYCGCMQNECKGEFDTIETCLAHCRGVTDQKAKCQRVHCEFAPFSTSHCKHASGVSDKCADVTTLSMTTCTSGQEKGYPCQITADCCATLECTALTCQ